MTTFPQRYHIAYAVSDFQTFTSLAKKIRSSPYSPSNWWNVYAKPSERFQKPLAEALDVDEAWLYQGKGSSGNLKVERVLRELQRVRK